MSFDIDLEDPDVVELVAVEGPDRHVDGHQTARGIGEPQIVRRCDSRPRIVSRRHSKLGLAGRIGQGDTFDPDVAILLLQMGLQRRNRLENDDAFAELLEMMDIKAKVASDIDGDLGFTAQQGEERDFLLSTGQAAHASGVNKPGECFLDQCLDRRHQTTSIQCLKQN
jgi:hypothetical protein